MTKDDLRRLVARAARIVGNDHDAEDAVQEAAIRTWRSGVQPASELAYLMTATKREALNLVRDARAEKRGGKDRVDVPLDEVQLAHPSSAEAELIARQELDAFHARFREAYAELPPLTQRVLSLRRQHKPAQIAKLLGESELAVRSRLKRAGEQLRAKLGKPPEGVEWILGDDES